MLRVAILGGLAAGALFVLDRMANLFTRPTPRPPDRTIDQLERVAWEDLLIPAGDHALAAWLLRPQPGAADASLASDAALESDAAATAAAPEAAAATSDGAATAATATLESDATPEATPVPRGSPALEASAPPEASAALEPRTSRPRALYVLAHGWGASYGTLLRLGEPLVAAGHEVIVFDVRGHGRNEALPYVTVRHFRDDAATVLRWVGSRFPGRPVVLVGHSLGGAGAVLAAAEGAPLDGLVLIAAPADVMQVTAEYLSDQGLPGALIVRFFRPFFWRRIGGSFRSLTPSRRIADVRVPLLLIQPEHDARVVREHAERLAEAAHQPYVLISGTEHTDVLEHPETLRLVKDFTRSIERARD